MTMKLHWSRFNLAVPIFCQFLTTCTLTLSPSLTAIILQPLTNGQMSKQKEIAAVETTVLVLRMVHRKWKETKQQPSKLPIPAVPGSCLVSIHILWAILSTSTVGVKCPMCPGWGMKIVIFSSLKSHKFGCRNQKSPIDGSHECYWGTNPSICEDVAIHVTHVQKGPTEFYSGNWSIVCVVW